VFGDTHDSKSQLSGEQNRGATGCNSVMLVAGKMFWSSEAHVKWVTGAKHNQICLALSFFASFLTFDV